MIDVLIQFVLILLCLSYIWLLSKHLFVIETLDLIGFTFFGFAQNTMHDFQNTVLNSYGHCLRQNFVPQKLNLTNEKLLS